MSGTATSTGLHRRAAQRAAALGLGNSLSVGLATVLAAALATAGELPAPGAATPSPPPFVQAVARQGPCRLVVELSPAVGRVCDDLSLRLSLHHPKGATIQKVVLGGEAESFLVRESHEEPPQPDGGEWVSQRRYVLEALQAGQIAIGPVEVTVATNPPEGPAELVLRTEPLPVELHTVVALPARLEALRPPAAPPAVPQPQAPGLPWPWAAALGAAVLVLGGLVWRWAGRRATGRRPGGPQAEARRRLAQLVADGKPPTDAKAFYVGLADIVRQYLAQAAGVPALEQTSEECLRAVHQRRIFSPEAEETLARFFAAADRVKFARWQPQPAEIRESVRQVESILDAPVLSPSDGVGESSSALHVEAAP